MRDASSEQIPPGQQSALEPRLLDQIRALAARCDGPFYVYQQARIE